jgi:outer membrane scaffolding protein for murein synthesis (MipA/OmpV family)
VGAKYRSSSLMNYQFGVADSEVGAYEPSSGVDYTAQIDLTYPISKNVLFQIYSSYTQFSDEMLDSSKIRAVRKWNNRPEKEQVFGVLVQYVF